ncbi:hypothetical protein SDC9_116751 [bioreactor metagenome]|uniref:Uncharacterized protein n=1 Tax=bioreactor metagenome TaxID=1076179 RepID=A0A645C387_9ZZZZ
MLTLHKAVDVVPVRYNQAVKAELIPQDGLQRLFACREGRAVDRAVRGHHRCAPSLNCLLERRQEHVPQFPVGHLRIAGVAPANCFAVADIVLGAGEDALVAVQPLALIAADNRGTQHRR